MNWREASISFQTFPPLLVAVNDPVHEFVIGESPPLVVAHLVGAAVGTEAIDVQGHDEGGLGPGVLDD